MDYNYKESIQKIHDLDWSKAQPARIIKQALFFAKEFPGTARECGKTYSGIPEFESFIAGELDTDNLQFADYNQKADHYLFLDHFYHGKHDRGIYPEISIGHDVCIDAMGRDKLSFKKEEIACKQYLHFIENMYGTNAYDDIMMATLVSREVSLKGIFQKILKAHDWDELGYGYYKYFLERHIELDSADGGHEELTSRLVDLEDYELWLGIFWDKRWRVYKTLL